MDGFSGSEFDSVDQKMSAAAVDKVRGMFDMPLLLAVQKKNGYNFMNWRNCLAHQWDAADL